MAEKKAKPDLYLSKDRNVEHLQWLHISLVSTAASKNNLYAVFAELFMSLTYVTIRPETVYMNLNLACAYNFLYILPLICSMIDWQMMEACI